MPNLDSILKSRGITLLIKVHIVKAMIFPVVTEECESWTIKKIAPKSWCFSTVGLEKTLEHPLNCKKIKPVNSKGNSPEYSLEGLTLKLKFQYLCHLMWRTDPFEKILMLGKIEGRKRRGRQRMRWLDVITDSMDKSLSKPQEMMRIGKSGVLQFTGVKKSQTRLSDWTELNWGYCCVYLVFPWTTLTWAPEMEGWLAFGGKIWNYIIGQQLVFSFTEEQRTCLLCFLCCC